MALKDNITITYVCSETICPEDCKYKGMDGCHYGSYINNQQQP